MSVVHRQGMTVLDLILEAGGLNDFAKGNGAKLYRKIEGKLKVYPVNISDMLNDGNIESNYLLAPSDILTVPERSF
jgi:polysaccharide export outer membrane protein